MSNELIEHKSWWNRHWKWIIPAVILFLITVCIVLSSKVGSAIFDISQAYSETELYKGAFTKAKENERVKIVLGELKPIDKIAIFEGETSYTNNNTTIKSSIRISGDKGKARLDIIANKINNEWIYNIINVRIKKPVEKKETIIIYARN
jgi:hypothetical protein